MGFVLLAFVVPVCSLRNQSSATLVDLARACRPRAYPFAPRIALGTPNTRMLKRHQTTHHCPPLRLKGKIGLVSLFRTLQALSC